MRSTEPGTALTLAEQARALLIQEYMRNPTAEGWLALASFEPDKTGVGGYISPGVPMYGSEHTVGRDLELAHGIPFGCLAVSKVPDNNRVG